MVEGHPLEDEENIQFWYSFILYCFVINLSDCKFYLNSWIHKAGIPQVRQTTKSRCYTATPALVITIVTIGWTTITRIIATGTGPCRSIWTTVVTVCTDKQNKFSLKGQALAKIRQNQNDFCLFQTYTKLGYWNNICLELDRGYKCDKHVQLFNNEKWSMGETKQKHNLLTHFSPQKIFL